MVDNLITYMALLPVFGVAAITSGAYRLFRHVHDDIDGNILAYATAGALGSGLILLIADVLDEYFTPGFSGIWMAFGLVAGSAFGAIYALLCNRLQRS
ncbi:hypothetical protein [Rhizobium herbae]|uniref:ABC-type Na+ efflux pump permease subunit n=1 Tax=Rhizobium herbae TaxID=508661 RepID=A0ABS4ENY1_9HYPH|nr:hypothetical protein [Rhizobium herbae]MBP1859521.1 ABC-type Na+ efflux pump permease subunit [Rhizobium herbae]